MQVKTVRSKIAAKSIETRYRSIQRCHCRPSTMYGLAAIHAFQIDIRRRQI